MSAKNYAKKATYYDYEAVPGLNEDDEDYYFYFLVFEDGKDSAGADHTFFYLASAAHRNIAIEIYDPRDHGEKNVDIDKTIEELRTDFPIYKRLYLDLFEKYKEYEPARHQEFISK